MSALFRNLARRKKVEHDQDPRFAPQIRPVPLPSTGSPQYQLQALSSHDAQSPTPGSPYGLGLVWVLVPATPAPQIQNTPLPASPVKQPPSIPSQSQPPFHDHPAPSSPSTRAPASPSSTHATNGSATPQIPGSPAVHPSSRSSASSSGRAEAAHRTTYAPQGSRRRRASSATAPPTHPSQLSPAQQQQPSSNREHTVSSARSTRATRGSPVSQSHTAMNSEPTPAAPVVSTQLASPAQRQAPATSELSPPVKAALDGEGAVLVDQDFSFDRSTGICSVSLMSSWETVRRIAVTRPVTVSDLYQVLKHATNLEYAYFECITEDSERSDIYGTEFTVENLETLVIARAEVPISAIFHDMLVTRLESLKVSYAPGAAYNLWSDEVYLALFLQRGLLAIEGTVSIASNEEWYRDQRAEALQKSLKVAVSRTRWSIYVS